MCIEILRGNNQVLKRRGAPRRDAGPGCDNLDHRLRARLRSGQFTLPGSQPGIGHRIPILPADTRFRSSERSAVRTPQGASAAQRCVRCGCGSEQAKARGCRTLIAYADGEVPTARNAQLTTLLLPALAKAPPVALPASGTASAAPVPQTAGTPVQTPNSKVASMVAQLRTMITKKPGSGYAAPNIAFQT